MIINFNAIEETRIPEFKGGVGETISRTYVDEKNRIMYGRLEPGSSVGYHKHETSSEIIYILSGKADFLYDDGNEEIVAGGCHYCPKNHSHSMINNGTEDLIYFAVVAEQ